MPYISAGRSWRGSSETLRQNGCIKGPLFVPTGWPSFQVNTGSSRAASFSCSAAQEARQKATVVLPCTPVVLSTFASRRSSS